jgi:putative endonuclease
MMGDWLRHRARLRLGNDAHAWGRRGEDLAHRYLQACGYIVIGRNWRTRSGSAEVDIIAADGDTIVFVEVKTRATEAWGTPDQAVDEAKRRHMMRAAAEYLRLIDADFSRARFDIVSVLFGDGESVVHHRDAIPKPSYQYLDSHPSHMQRSGESV